MKFKKLLATVLVAICAFMLVGCGQMTAKESVETAVANATEIQVSATKIAEGSMQDPSASGLAVTFDENLDLDDIFGDMSGFGDMNNLMTFVQDLTEKGMAIAGLAENMLTKVTGFGSEVIKLGTLAPQFLASYDAIEAAIEDADVAELSKNANVLKDAKSQFETMAREIEAKALELQQKMGDMSKLESEDFEEVMAALQNLDTEAILGVFDYMIEKVTTSVEKMSEVTTAIKAINTVLEKYVQPAM